MIVKSKSPIIEAKQLTQFYKNSAMGEGMGEYETAGGGSYGGTHYGVDGPDSSDAQFKKEMAEGEGEGEYWTAGGGSYLGVDGPDSNDAVFKKEMAEGEGEGEYWTAGGGSYLGADGDWTQSGSKWGGTMSSAEGVSDDGQVRDNFRKKEISTGGVTIKTDNPVYEDTAIQEHEWLSSFGGGGRAARRAKRASRRSRRSAKGSFGDRLSSGWNKLTNSGVLQSLGGALGGGQQGMDPGMDPSLMSPMPLTPMPQQRGMSTGAKVGIAVGVIALVGVGIYMYQKNKGKGGKK